jgi:hypothetical protein
MLPVMITPLGSGVSWLFSCPPFSVATAKPFASVGDSVPALPLAAGRLPCVPPPPWNMKRPFQFSAGSFSSKRVP